MLDAMDYFSVRTDTMRCRVRFGKAHFQKPTVLEGSGAKQEVADRTDVVIIQSHPMLPNEARLRKLTWMRTHTFV